jgi:hypothetical protein
MLIAMPFVIMSTRMMNIDYSGKRKWTEALTGLILKDGIYMFTRGVPLFLSAAYMESAVMEHLKEKYTYEEWDVPPPTWFLGFVMLYHPFVVVGTHVMYARFFTDSRDKIRYRNSVKALQTIL